MMIRVKEFGFDGGGNVFERTVYYSYNVQGLLDKIELSTDDIKNNSNYAKTELIRFTYNEKGQPIEVREQGLHTKYGYDNQGNLNLITYPDGQTVHYTYNTHNKPTRIKMGNQFVMMDYDDRQRPIHYNNHLGQILDIDYDDVAHTINYTLANGQVVSDVYSSEYDLIKRSIKDSQGKVIFTSLGSEMMNNGLSTQNSTNPINTLIINNALAKLTLNTGATYTRHYDDFGRVYLATDANTGKRYIRYDNFDRPTQIMLDGINQELSYNSFGLPNTFKVCNISSNTQDCQYTHYHYDTYGKLTKVQHSQTQDGKTPSIQHQYTNTGLLASETTTLISHQGYTTAYHYDDKDRVKSVSLPEGITLHYHYNTHSQVTQIDYQTPTSTLWQTLTNKWYKVFNKDKGDALLSNIQADSTRGLLGLQHTNGSTVSQVYDDKAKLTDKHDHTTSTKLSYDKQTGQITSIDDNGNVKTVAEINNAYEYDDNGNRTKHHHTHYTYKPNSDRLSIITTKDDKDNIIKTTHYTYDNLGNPVMITTKDHKGNENAKINIVGHSLGGWQAAHLAQQLEEWRCGSVGVVTTLDPVGIRYSYNLAGSINFKTPNPKYKTWVNIRAEAKDTSINDVIANLGGQWDPSSLNPTYNYTLEVDHAYAYTMFTTKIPNRNLSPRDLINRSYLNNKNIKEYERATDVGRKDTGD